MKLNSNEQTLRRLQYLLPRICFMGSFAFAGVPAVSATETVSAGEVAVQEIVINDCDGVTRAQLQNPGRNTPHNLRVSLLNDSPAPASLLLTSGSHSVEEKVLKGEASFSNLKGGTYQICDRERMSKISSVTLEPASDDSVAAVSGSTVGGVLAGAAAVGGTVLALNSGGSSSDSSSAGANSLVGGSGTGSASGSAVVAPATNSAVRSPARNDRDCLNGAKVNPISPFD